MEARLHGTRNMNSTGFLGSEILHLTDLDLSFSYVSCRFLIVITGSLGSEAAIHPAIFQVMASGLQTNFLIGMSGRRCPLTTC